MSEALRIGSHGVEVERLQLALQRAGFSPRGIDSVFGSHTQSAVAGYQAAHGLPVTGVADGPTLDALCPPRPLAPALPGCLMGVDLSDAQGLVDAPALARAGVSFAYLKASDGEHDGQQHAAANAVALDATGIAIGYYGVLEPYGLARVAGQVANFQHRVAALPPASAPPWCDFEMAHGIAPLDALESAAAWCESVEGAVVYTGPAFVDGLARYAGASDRAQRALARLAVFPLAVAHYTGSLSRLPYVPRPWASRGWAVWQYGPGEARLPGSGRPVDVDYIRGTLAELQAMGRG